MVTFGGLLGHLLGLALFLVRNVFRVVDVLLQDVFLVDNGGAAAGRARLRGGRVLLLRIVE